ncbi:retrotransposon gag protein domain-containing protein [Phthorimaea operculella]|nr:retrotransposon gag protein domain-containing protein [Phthorimaea operculella]
MEYPVKFLSLQKTELEYEVLIRGSEPGSTVIELRKQIVDLGPKFPSEDITDSPLEIEEDLKGISDVLTKIKLLLDAPLEKKTSVRIQNLLHHLYHRFNRLSPDESTLSAHNACLREYQSLFTRYNAAVEAPVEDKIITPIANINLDQHSSMRPLNINVSCERAIAGELTKIKFDGKSCVRSFIQRITEFRKARDISSSKLLSYATEIFTGDALHWFRGLDGQDDSSDWDALLTRLKKDFDQTDYDYRLLSEIRARTQGENENITIYLSIMSGLFSRLSSELSNEDKLEILLHNIKPCYASTLASATTISDIDTLRSLCRNYENIHARLANYKEPRRPSSETLSPEYAYNGHSSNRSHNSNQNYKLSSNVGNNYDRNRSYPNYRANVNKLNPNNYVHALHTSNAKPKFCPRCRDNTHHLRQCTADRSKIICFVCGEDQPTDDPRPYATIYVNHISMLGLLDTGAVVTIIGNNRHIDLEKQGFKLQQGQSLTVTAAGGQRMHSIGHMILPAKFEVQTFPNHLKSISFLKDVTSIASIDSAPSSCLQAYDHLSQSEKAIADNIIAQFNDISTENKGMGETKLTHEEQARIGLTFGVLLEGGCSLRVA